MMCRADTVTSRGTNDARARKDARYAAAARRELAGRAGESSRSPRNEVNARAQSWRVSRDATKKRRYCVNLDLWVCSSVLSNDCSSASNTRRLPPPAHLCSRNWKVSSIIESSLSAVSSTQGFSCCPLPPAPPAGGDPAPKNPCCTSSWLTISSSSSSNTPSSPLSSSSSYTGMSAMSSQRISTSISISLSTTLPRSGSNSASPPAPSMARKTFWR
mmetsp:Transcript_30564/g.97567  ORF Transcript_30564/g.97567 Transcript_30564/m.97567 type:complete len:216 (+) Transcript_30564:398-1045(+)